MNREKILQKHFITTHTTQKHKKMKKKMKVNSLQSKNGHDTYAYNECIHFCMIRVQY